MSIRHEHSVPRANADTQTNLPRFTRNEVFYYERQNVTSDDILIGGIHYLSNHTHSSPDSNILSWLSIYIAKKDTSKCHNTGIKFVSLINVDHTAKNA